LFDGFNGTILAYGQTSSGKTFTMQGINYNHELEGVIPRIIRMVFEKIDKNKTEDISYVVKISMVEIYNEKFKV
jgi:kinesin family protein 5